MTRLSIGFLALSFALLGACTNSRSDHAAAIGALDEDAPINYCSKFPPDATGDPNATDDDCEIPDGEQTVYCHLHTGPDGAGCADLPGGPSPQLHCLLPGEGEHEGVFGGALDCDAVAARIAARVVHRVEHEPVPPIVDEPEDAVECDEAHHGIPITVDFPAQDDACTCCVIPLTGNPDPNADCSDPEVECVKVYFGEACGVPPLGDDALAALCEGVDRGLACMKKDCVWADDQQCLGEDGLYVPCHMLETPTCCIFATGGMAMVAPSVCERHGGEDRGATEDCFGGDLPDGVVPRVDAGPVPRRID